MKRFSFVLALALLSSAGSLLNAAAPEEIAAQVDQLLNDAWKNTGITPAPTVEDAGFLRRVTLDLTGQLPTVAEVEAFLADSSANKRAAVVTRLLAAPGYARHQADYWDAILMGRLTREAYIDRNGFHKWLMEQFARHRPWDQIARDLVTAEGYNTDRKPKGSPSDPRDWPQRFHPATNWFLRYFRSLPDYSGAVAKNLMGVQIQCAQCHNHPTEKWKQSDFEEFTALFTKTWPAYYDRTLVVGIHRVDTRDRWVAPPQIGAAAPYFSSYTPYVSKTPKLLDGSAVSGLRSRRQAFADWMTAPKNAWFARAFVNRTWKRLLGTGFVEPQDDFRPSNPATLPEVLDLLANDFSAHGYDIPRLTKIITATAAYQRACAQPAVKTDEHPLWSAYPIKSLDIEVGYDILLQATNGNAALERIAQGKSDLVRQAFARQFIAELGTDEKTEAAAEDATIPRVLMQLNGAMANGLTRAAPGLGLRQVLQSSSTPENRIRALYLRTLSRHPTDTELTQWQRFLRERQRVAHAEGPPMRLPTGLAAARLSPMIAKAEMGGKSGATGENAMELRELLLHARTGADFKALAKRIRNNADAGMYAKAIEAFAAQAPFEYLANLTGATNAAEQAYEDLFWALVSCSEFTTNH